jgi:uncharacterized protein GlcG (DUF336 family)
MLGFLLGRSEADNAWRKRLRRLRVERLESRFAPAITSVLSGGVLTITGDANHDYIRVKLDQATNDLLVTTATNTIAQYAEASVTSIIINVGSASHDIAIVDPDVDIAAQINGGNGGDTLEGGGGSPTFVTGGAGNDKLIAGPGQTTLSSDGGINHLFDVKPGDQVYPGPNDTVTAALQVVNAPAVTFPQLTAAQVQQLIQRAEGSTAYDDAIIAVVDRSGRLLGVTVENGVSTAITGNTEKLVFAIDGAISEARTAAFFASDSAPLTSRTIQFISQSTITQREVESDPTLLAADPNSTLAGPGFVAPIGTGGHFPPNVNDTPQVDLFDIEGTNRDTSVQDGVTLPSRFNVPLADIPSSIQTDDDLLAAPDSYGYISGLEPNAQPRGIGTLPGGIPIYTTGSDGKPDLVGGIGVFFPGTTGYADEENSSLSSNYNPAKPDLSVVAEYMAFAALGGLPKDGYGVGTVAGIPPVNGVSLFGGGLGPNGRIDLVGVTLPLFGPQGLNGPGELTALGKTLGVGNPNGGTAEPVDPQGDLYALPKPQVAADGTLTPATDQIGTAVPSGWLVTPHDGVGVTAAEATQIIEQGIQQAEITRAAIRLPLDSTTEMVFAVSDEQGNIIALYRMPDATVFSIAVAVAKARNVAYYNNASELQPADELPGVTPGTALTSRSFRYLAEPRYPEGINGEPAGPFSILNDGGSDPNTALNTGAPLPASAFQSVLGYDSFHPNTNFHDPYNPLNQNGVVFFPGSSGVYADGNLVGGFGVSGDGVDQDDVVTTMGINGYAAPQGIRIDQVFVKGVRVPYSKFNRNPEGGITDA